VCVCVYVCVVYPNFTFFTSLSSIHNFHHYLHFHLYLYIYIYIYIILSTFVYRLSTGLWRTASATLSRPACSPPVQGTAMASTSTMRRRVSPLKMSSMIMRLNKPCEGRHACT
jgi:hypothetical protein